MNEFPSSIWIILVLIIAFSHLSFFFCCSLNDEGIGLLKFKERVTKDPFGVLSSWKEDDGETKFCSWFGVECVDGHVVSLDLRDLCLEGTLASELHYLQHIRSIILRNNSFSGAIPEEIKDLKELKLLDLVYNNFTGPFLPEIGDNISILLLDNNRPPFDLYPKLEEHVVHSEAQLDENRLTCAMQTLTYTRHNGWRKNALPMRILQQEEPQTGSSSLSSPTSPLGRFTKIDPKVNHIQPPPQAPFLFRSLRSSNPPGPVKPHLSPPPSPLASTGAPVVSPPPPRPPPDSSPSGPANPPVSSGTPILTPPPKSSPSGPQKKPVPKNNLVPIVAGVVAGFVGLVLIIGAIYLWRSKNIIIVREELSGQLHSAFITGNGRSDGFDSAKPSFIEGMPNLKMSELETACEEFSNVIGSSSIGILYKGRFLSGTEIAVISFSVKSAEDWSQQLEKQFRDKVEALSTVKHKNFVNLIGYCEEKSPFARMMVFEYAPSGTLFEHLHVREAEHLDWRIRLRVTMGMAYCLEHMHQLVPPIIHPNFNSSAVNLSEDYAAKVSDFCLWNQLVAAQMPPINLEPSTATLESNVYNFGLVLLEMVTGRVTLSLENNSLEDWTLDYLKGERPLQEWVDPMLRSFKHGQLEKIDEVIKKCLHQDPQKRPTAKDVAMRLKEITGIDRDKAAPRFCSLWGEELEVLSVS